MRFLVRRIYRAFPELDRYSDEQCLRFVRATKRRFWTKWGHRGVIGVAALVAMCAAGLGCVCVTGWLEDYQNAVRRDLPWLQLSAVLACAPLLAVVPVVAFITRDLLLRRRVRYVLRTRSACPGCGYRLIGLSVSGGNTITCPECGMVCAVDPSLSELALDESGLEQLHHTIIAPARRFWTARRRRVALWATVLIIGPTAMLAGGYELWLRRQASVAGRERPGMAGLVAFAESSWPGDGPNGWNYLEAAIKAKGAADARVWSTATRWTSDGRMIYPDYSLVYSRGVNGPQDELERESRALAVRMLGEYRDEGVAEHLKLGAASVRAWRPTLDNGQPSAFATFPDAGQVRELGMINAGRMVLAAKAGDVREFLEALEQNLALSRIMQHQPFLVDTLTGYKIDRITFRPVQLLLSTRPDAETLGSLADIMRRQEAHVKRDHFLEGYRLMALDHVGWYFSDPSRVRFGKYSQGFKAQLGGMGSGVRLGTYVENRDAINAVFAGAKKDVDVVPGQRVGLWRFSVTDLFWVRNLTGGLDQILMIQDGHELDLRGLRLLVALERCRAERGDYPAALTELVPAFIDELPLDVWSGNPFHYVRVDPKNDRLGRSFLLYSVGADGVDDGGHEQPMDVLDSWRTKPGLDFVVNRWDDVYDP
jgi:hypothetical protein